MDAIQAIHKRRSIRKYQQTPVEWDKIVTILDAGRVAPSGGNLQDWRFIVVNDKAAIRDCIAAAYSQNWIDTAPVLIIVNSLYEKSADMYGLRGERLYTIQNSAAAIQNMLIAATSLGLGTCWVGAFDEDKLRSCLAIPKNVRPQALITLGYADSEPDPVSRRKIEDVTFLHAFGNKIRHPDRVLKDYTKTVQSTVEASKSAIKKSLTDLFKISKK